MSVEAPIRLVTRKPEIKIIFAGNGNGQPQPETPPSPPPEPPQPPPLPERGPARDRPPIIRPGQPN